MNIYLLWQLNGGILTKTKIEAGDPISAINCSGIYAPNIIKVELIDTNAPENDMTEN